MGRRKDTATIALPGMAATKTSKRFSAKFIAPEFGGAEFGKYQGEVAKLVESRTALPTGLRTIDVPELRDYQEEAVKKLLWAISKKNPNAATAAATVICTGAGKTLIFAEIARKVSQVFKRKVLIVCNQTELIEQALGALERIGVMALREQSTNRAREELGQIEDVVVVASQQSLRGERLEQWPADFFDLIIHDECDLAFAPTWKKLFEYFVTARHIGLTATPDRLDGDMITSIFPVIPFTYPLGQAVAEGWLVRPIEKRAQHNEIDLRKIRVTKGDFDLKELDIVISDNISNLAEASIEPMNGKPTIAFLPTIFTSKLFADAMNNLGISARSVDGKSKTRDQDIQDFKNGEYLVLCNCNLINRGVDIPRAENALLAAPTVSRAKFAQQVGRVTRPYEDPLTGYVKETCTIINFAWKFQKKNLKLPHPVDLWDTTKTDTKITNQARIMYDKILEEFPQAEIDVEKLLEKSAEVIQQNIRGRLRLTLKGVKASITTIDPLILEVLDVPTRPSTNWAQALPATPQQLKYLNESFGVDTDKIENMSMQKASRLIEELKSRRESGKATWKQVRQLIKLDVDLEEARQYSFEEARTYLDANMQWKPNWRRGWKPKTNGKTIS